MATEVRKSPSPSSVGDNSSTKVPTFSVAPGFTALENLFHPDKEYFYRYEAGGELELKMFTKSTPNNLEGIAFFCQILLEESYEPIAQSNFNQVAETCAAIARKDPQVTAAQFATAVRRTLRDINHSGIKVTQTEIPTKVYEQLMAILVFVKALPHLPGEVSQSADALLEFIRNTAVAESTNPIYFHIQNKFSLFFQKDGSWTKTYNNWGLGKVFGYGI